VVVDLAPAAIGAWTRAGIASISPDGKYLEDRLSS
jgi:hypothetical protein